ncbi:MAG: hypothetical protein HMLKMBBP_02514 [Planctomycetes bacterium]|nr:hypothetical protein [Planctomycetota bacterium]
MKGRGRPFFHKKRRNAGFREAPGGGSGGESERFRGRGRRADDDRRGAGASIERVPRYEPPPPVPRPPELTPTDRTYRGLRLFPFQARAVDAVAAGHSVLVAAPTGSGKTLVADYAIDTAFERGWRVVYTSPIKALSNQKYRDFRARHGDAVGILTGDVTMRPDAPLLVMTTEVFRNTLFDEPARLRDFRFVIHDEVHYLDDRERGTVWEESIIHAPADMRLVCLSATVPNVQEMADWIGTIRGEPVTVVESASRPVPLDHMIWVPDHGPLAVKEGCAVLDLPLRQRRLMRRERTPGRLLDWLERERLLPALVFSFRRKDCETLAADSQHRDLLTGEEQGRMAALFDDLAARYELGDAPAVRSLRRLALRGVAWHHAGMLPIHKEVVERLFTSGLVKMLFATETFALGVNMPARTVAFTQLRKFDGERMDYMLCREYGQMAGRAGRQGIDGHGLVVSMVDPVMDRSSGVRRVLTGTPEAVQSRWNPDYSTLLALYEHLGDRVLETYEKSFARFQREARRGKRDGRSAEERTMASRLRVLARHGYIRDGKVTGKGQFASSINGYEIHAAEWRAAGVLERADTYGLASLLLAAAYEPRQDEPPQVARDAGVRKFRNDANDVILAWRESEWDAGLAELSKGPDFGLSAALFAWMDGEPLAEAVKRCSVGEGDFVRWLRVMLQYARQIRKALPKEESEVRDRIAEAMRMVDRDEVDARRQLELGEEAAGVEDPAAMETPAAAAPGADALDVTPDVAPDVAPTVAPPAREAREPAPPEPEDDDFGSGLG